MDLDPIRFQYINHLDRGGIDLPILGYFYNVCLNNYSKQKSDKAGNTKNKNQLA